MFPTDNNFESEFTFEHSAVPVSDDPPFNILILGDWSGGSDKKALNERVPVIIDRDNFDEVLKRSNVELKLDFQGDENKVLHLQFKELDDFHPDNLFRNVSLFSDLREIRSRLLNSDTFDNAANEVRSWFVSTNENSIDITELQSEINDVPPIDSSDLLDMILTPPTSQVSSSVLQTTDSSELSRFVANIISPHLVKIDENEQSELIAAVDEIISESMRAILHHPVFQSLESAWRGLYFLVRRLETSADLKIFILDISQAELANNLKVVDSLADSFLYHQLVFDSIETTRHESFALIGGNYSFSVNVNDIALLLRIAKLADAAVAPFVSYIKPEIFGYDNFSEIFDSPQLKVLESSDETKIWMALRSSPQAKFLGLSSMKILGRLPYGETTEPIESFSFEEFTNKHDEKKFLWINSCFPVALILGQAYRQYGWQMGQFLRGYIENLPLYTYQQGGETKTTPCAEIVLTENSLEIILEQGLIPLISFRNSDKVKIEKISAIGLPLTNLEGRWNK